MTWNKLVAPEREVARGSPQDSICITVAARFGSTPAAFAQRTISFPQCWTSFVKTGESPLAEVELFDEVDQIGIAAEFCAALGRAEGESGNLSATSATKPAIRRAASGGRT